jgi:4'-phosphopantetheinyl transferase EntD
MHATEFESLRQRLPPGILLDIAPVTDCVAELHEQEQVLVAHAVQSRRQEFSSARRLAKTLLLQLGMADLPLLAHQDRSPAWPTGILGSLSHSRKWCAAAICPTHQNLLGIGVDVEDRHTLRQELFPEILTPAELERMQLSLPAEQQPAFVLSVFSIKEALYKAMWPLGNTGLGFHALELDFGDSPICPNILPLPDLQSRLPAGCSPEAHHARHNGTLLSVVLLPAPTQCPPLS